MKMQKIIPEKLKVGDEIRVIALSRNMELLTEETISIATKRLEELGLKVTFGKHVYKTFDENYCCSSIEDRIEDFHAALEDKNVAAILSVIGGFNVNQILDYIDYELIKNNPKIICGFSDITALCNAIYQKTGVVTYSGPHFSSFGMIKGFDYTLEYFKKMFFENKDISIEESTSWSDDAWYINQEDRKFYPNEGVITLHKGDAMGTIIGGNLCTLNLLQGTEYMPDVDNIVLFLEDDEMAGLDFIREFDRNLQSLLHCLKNKNIEAIIVGRAQISNQMTVQKWKTIFETKKELQNVPILINADFGHTTPIFTFPIGGTCEVKDGKIKIYEK